MVKNVRTGSFRHEEQMQQCVFLAIGVPNITAISMFHDS